MAKRLALYLLVAVAGFGLGVFALYVKNVRSGPALEIWHTVELAEELKPGDLDRVPTFDDYLALEERLFAELDRKIYARTASGPGFELARFSAGSLADPRDDGPNWNRSFELAGEPGAGGVLLLHGMSDSPYSLRALGESLNRRGLWVVGVRLPGHGTIPAGIRTVAWEEMAVVVRLGMERLATVADRGAIHVVGYSTGAPLALDYVLDRLDGSRDGAMPASLVLVSPSIGVARAAAAAAAGWMDRFSALPGLEKLAWTSIRPEFDPYKYNSFTTNAGYQVHRLTRSVVSRVEALAAEGPIDGLPPTLTLLSTVDATVSVDAAVDNLLEHLAPDRHELILFDVNRWNVPSTILVADPGPLTARLLEDDSLPFHLTLIANESSESPAVVSRHKVPFSAEVTTEPLALEWPRGLISLSHIALQFPPDDPLYGRRDLQPEGALPLGQIGVQGERGLLVFPSDWLLRVRHNPFYDYLESRVVEWVGAGPAPGRE